MTWEVEWLPVAHADVLRMNWRTASRACATVYAFAERGAGEPEILAGDLMRLRGPGFVVLLRAERPTRTLVVGRIFAT
jgi:hypothetical protein